MSQDNRIGSYITGDDDPTEFDFSSYLTPEEILTLLVTSDPINKQCVWLPAQALAAGWKFKKDAPFLAEKFGKPYSFPSFTDWFNWCGAYNESRVAITFAKAFRRSIAIGFMAEENPSDLKGKPYYGPITPPSELITKIVACYPYLNQNGFKVYKLDENDEPEIYGIHITDRDIEYYEEDMENKPLMEEKIYYVHASRVVEFIAPKKEMGMKGTSEIQLTGHVAIVQREMFRSVMSIAKNLEAGVAVARAKDKTEADYIDEKMANFSHLTRIKYAGSGPLDDVIKIVVPELKVNQFERFNLVLQKYLGSAMGISIRYMGEEDIATGLGDGGAGISHINTKFEIKEIQRHYKRSLEHVFYLMGKTDSEFEWNDPMVKDEELLKEQNPLNDKEKPTKDQSDASISNPDTEDESDGTE